MDVTISEAIMVTIFSMAVVFVTLMIINFILKGFKSLFYKSQDKEDKIVKAKQTTVTETTAAHEDINTEGENNLEDEEELVAVITAALAASLGKPVAELKIQNIRRLSQNSSIWARAGRLEQMK